MAALGTAVVEENTMVFTCQMKKGTVEAMRNHSCIKQWMVVLGFFPQSLFKQHQKMNDKLERSCEMSGEVC